MLPLVRPALVAVVVLAMVGSWNGADWAKILAFVSLAPVPTVVFYLLAEKQIVTGLTAGAVVG
ncbi:MAG: hypothetical protein E6I75_20370 [Chloroflexi bacterium]|nr:MAG: hypothetical protein E6I75_20370 [Chloroflexota bacterium]